MWGGGQKVSLQIIEILAPHYSIHLADSTSKSLFVERAKPYSKGFIRTLGYGPDIFQKTLLSFSKRALEFCTFPFLSFINFFIILAYSKKNVLNKENTLIYAATKKGLYLAYIMNLVLGFRYIYHSHLPVKRNSMEIKLILSAFKRAQKIICVSAYVKDTIALDNCITIYNSVKQVPGVRAKQLNPSRIVVACISSLLRWKGVEYFMRAYKFLQNKQIFFHIYGDGPASELAKLKKLANNKVILKGFASHLDTILKEEVDILISPSIEPEGLSMSVLEALSFGIPVISTNLGEHGRMIKDGFLGYCVPPRDPQAIAEKIEILISHTRNYRKISSNCLQYAKSMDLSSFQKKNELIFKECH